MQTVVESVVTALVNAKLAQADDDLQGDSASPVVPLVIDAEAPR